MAKEHAKDVNVDLSKSENPIIKSSEPLDKYEAIWKYISAVVVIVSLYTTYTLIPFSDWAATHIKDATSLRDLAYVFILTIFIYFFRTIFKALIYNPIYDGLEGKYFGEEREQRAKKVTKWLHDVCYYSSTVAFVYYNYRDTIVPPQLLGNANIDTYFAHMPAVPSAEKYPYLREFYLVQMAAHLCTLLEQIFFKRDEAKYYEYFLHHHLSFIMILNSYIQHQWPMGSTVMLTHDITDIFLASTRAIEAFVKPSGKSLKSYLIYGYLLNTLIIWYYSRLYVAVYVSIRGSYNEIGNWGEAWQYLGFSYTFSVTLLGVLYILDVYWGLTMTKIVANTLIKKKYKNT
jgi:very-long-chain ceramide synthase